MSKVRKATKNFYHTVVPSHMKRKKHVEGLDALVYNMIEVLTIFIEKECSNGVTQYHPPLPADKREKIVKDIKNNYFSDNPDYDVLLEKYRGLSYGHAYVSLEFLDLVDLYYWFKFEEKEWFNDVEKDFSLEEEVPDGEKYFYSKKSSKTNGGYEIIFNKNRKYPDYKRKYIYEGLPEHYLAKVRQEKLKKLIDIYPCMWC